MYLILKSLKVPGSFNGADESGLKMELIVKVFVDGQLLEKVIKHSVRRSASGE